MLGVDAKLGLPLNFFFIAYRYYILKYTGTGCKSFIIIWSEIQFPLNTDIHTGYKRWLLHS